MLKFVATVVASAVGAHLLNQVAQRSTVLQQAGSRALVLGVGIADAVLTKVAQQAMTKQQAHSNNGGAQ
jgi:hypothetical protein